VPNAYFQFKQFTIHQDKCAMKVTTDACLFGAWITSLFKIEDLRFNNCLDIGTGTGLLALMVAQKNPAIVIDAIEIDKDAFEQAGENVAASPWANSIKIIHADAKEFIALQKYDIIISNPPFYEKELKSDQPKKNIAHHSEDLSLQELLSVIKNNLQPTGSFYLLLPYKRHKEIRELMLKNELTITQMMLVRQTVDHDYFRIMLSGKLKENSSGETSMNEMAVTGAKGQYTVEFVNLLKDYYLNL
jgi:tRNA1Val (adenine37-N6)-methyltransferase